MLTKERIINCFSKSVSTYDAAAELQTQVATRLAKRISTINANAILEIGCGTGIFSQYLVKQYHQSEILLTDIVPAMVNVCRNRFPGIQVECMDGEALTCINNFDLVVSCMTLHWFTTIKTSIKKIIHQLSHNGQLVFSMLGNKSFPEWHAICQKMNYPIPTPQFPSSEFLNNSFPNMKIESEILQIKYDSIYHFIKTLKNIGAGATYENYIPLSSGNMSRLIREWNRETAISYEIIYGEYVKS